MDTLVHEPITDRTAAAIARPRAGTIVTIIAWAATIASWTLQHTVYRYSPAFLVASWGVLVATLSVTLATRRSR